MTVARELRDDYSNGGYRRLSKVGARKFSGLIGPSIKVGPPPEKNSAL